MPVYVNIINACEKVRWDEIHEGAFVKSQPFPKAVKNICSTEDMCRILHGIYFSFLCKYRTDFFFFNLSCTCASLIKLLKHPLCLLTLLQFRKASITLCDQTDMLKWDHTLILGFRELGCVFVPVPRLLQDTRKHDLISRNSTRSKILSLGHSLDSAFIWDLHIRPPFQLFHCGGPFQN